MLSKHTAPKPLDLALSGDRHWKSSEPTSPALSTTSFMSSVSWVADKTATELVSLLRNAYSAIREKEKDLTLAAEIGRSLLENNMTLKSQYERLLQHAQSYEPNVSDHSEEDEDDEDDMHFIPSQRAREAIIETLQRKNQEMQVMLDNALEQSEQIGRANDEKSQQLESHIDDLRQSLDLAAQKIQELEAGRRRRHQHPSTSEITSSSHTTDQSQRTFVTEEENAHLIHELTIKMARLEADHTSMSVAKKAVQNKLGNALRDLSHLRQQFEQFQFTQDSYDQLQQAYQQQFKRIEELNKCLEEHRTVLARLRDRGMPLPSLSEHDPSLSTSTATTSSSRTLHTRNEEDGNKNLLDELQLVFGKRLAGQSKDGESLNTSEDTSSSESNESESVEAVEAADDKELSQAFPALSSWAHMAERNLTSFYNAPSEYALQTALPNVGMNDRAIMDEARRLLAFIDGEDTPDGMPFDDDDLYHRARVDYASLDLYPQPSLDFANTDYDQSLTDDEPKGLIGHIKHLIQNLFSAVWRWCRFAIVLTAAILINLWHGPEAFLEK